LSDPRHLGNSDRHLAARLAQHGVRLRGVAFGHGDWLEELSRLDRPVDVAYRPVINDYRGRRSVELHLVDWRRSPRPALAVEDG
jgi:single-stranded-DNA-specific exonuclease